MRLSLDETLKMETDPVTGMASLSSSNETFCSLDMLAEVASATLQNDPSLMPYSPLQRTKNVKAGNSFSRKSVTSCEKLTLDQIKNLSEKNLIEMFSEHVCDEMKKNYSFQCFLIPEKCSQIFKSFGNETRARYKIKAHLLSHIKDLAAASDANGGDELFMAEPLHVRRKRLKAEINQKSTRKKKKNKHIKGKKDNVEISASNNEDFNLWNEGLHLDEMAQNSNLNAASETVYHSVNRDMWDKANDIAICQSAKPLKNPLLCFSTHDYICDSGADQVILKGQSSSSDFGTNFLKSAVKRKRSKQCESKMPKSYKSEHNSFIKSSPESTDSNSHFNCDVHPESDACLQVHHDHTYTSVDGKTLHSEDKSSASESNRSVNKIIRDPFYPKKRVHRYLKRESPLIIPTPPFPYVYVPILPHIALIQEVGFSSNLAACSNDVFTESYYECSDSPQSVPLFIQSENESSKNSISQSESNTEDNVSDTEDDENIPSDAYIEDMSEDGSYGEASNIKLPNSSFCLDDLIKPECPENLKAVEKKLALKCIRALRTKKKEERGPLTCQICKNKSFTAQATLMYHYRSHAGIKPFTCSVCEATFTRQHSLNYHMLIHNNKSRFVCTDCGRTFRHPSHYKEHLRRHNGETPYDFTDCNLR